MCNEEYIQTRRERLPAELAALVTCGLIVGLVGLVGLFVVALLFVLTRSGLTPPKVWRVVVWQQNILRFAGILGFILAWWLGRRLYRALRWRTHVHRRTECGDCGYDLRGNTSGRCPECGWRRESECFP